MRSTLKVRSPDSKICSSSKGCKRLASLLEVVDKATFGCGHNELIGLTTKFQIARSLEETPDTSQ